MPSDKEYLNYILEECKNITVRPMMGEFILYYFGKIIGGIYDNRLLVKPTPSAKAILSDADYQIPYEGAKAMILVNNVDDKEFLQNLFATMYNELPNPPKKKKPKK